MGVEMKKIIITITILSLLNLIGCYYQEQMKPTKYNFKNEDDINVTTKDTAYNLGGKDYYYDNDTLFVIASKPLDERTTLEYTINIPVNSIEMIKVKKNGYFQYNNANRNYCFNCGGIGNTFQLRR